MLGASEMSVVTRTFAVLIAVFVVISTAAVGGVAGASGGEESGVRAVYVENGTVHTVTVDGEVHDTGVSASLVGSARDFVGDGREVPIVDGSGTVSLAEPGGDVRRLATGAKSTKSAVASGDVDGDGTLGVYYANASDNGYLYVAEPESAPRRVTATAAKAVSGVADFDGDGAGELVFTGSSSTVKYLDNGTVESTGYSSIGANNGYGLGPVTDFDGDGTARVALVDGSNNVVLVDDSGGKTSLTGSGYSAAKSPVGAVDWRGDDRLEALYLNKSAVVKTVALNGTVTTVRNANGEPVTGEPNAGVATSLGPPEPQISGFDATNPSGRTLNVTFESDTRLDEITVDIDGPENETLTESAFAATGDGPYTYAADYDVPYDGTYEAVLTEAVGPDGNDGATNQSASVQVETPAPTVRDATLASTSGMHPVNESATLRVRANVTGADGVNRSVEANASAFGAGTVTLASENGTWTGTFDVNRSGVDGNRSVTVVATNEYGHTDSAATNAVFLDTAAPDANVGPNVTVVAGTNVTFDGDATTDASALTYRWTFGDGETTTGQTAVHAYAEPGTYTATLTATDAANNTATATRTVTARETDTTDGSQDTTDGGSGGTVVREIERVQDAPSVERTWTTSETYRYEVSHANAGASVRIDVPSDTLDTLRVVPAVNGDFDLTLGVPNGSPNGTPVVGNGRAVEAAAYWTVNHGERVAFRSATFGFSVAEERLGERHAGAVALYRYANGSWRAHDSAVENRSNGTLRFYARAPGLSTFAAVVEQPDIEATDATLAATDIEVGDPLRGSVTVENTGLATGTETVALRLGDRTVERETVTLRAGDERTVSVAHLVDRSGAFDVSVGHADAGTLHVADASGTAYRTTTTSETTSDAEATGTTTDDGDATDGPGTDGSENGGTTTAESGSGTTTETRGETRTTRGQSAVTDLTDGVTAGATGALLGLLTLLAGAVTVLVRERQQEK